MTHRTSAARKAFGASEARNLCAGLNDSTCGFFFRSNFPWTRSGVGALASGGEVTIDWGLKLLRSRGFCTQKHTVVLIGDWKRDFR